MRECNYCRRMDRLGYMPDKDGHTPGEGWVCTLCAKEQRDEARLAAKVLWRADPYDPSLWAELWPWLDELEDGEKARVRQLVRSQFEPGDNST
jgi:hypothetical protein